MGFIACFALMWWYHVLEATTLKPYQINLLLLGWAGLRGRVEAHDVIVDDIVSPAGGIPEPCELSKKCFSCCKSVFYIGLRQICRHNFGNNRHLWE